MMGLKNLFKKEKKLPEVKDILGDKKTESNESQESIQERVEKVLNSIDFNNLDRVDNQSLVSKEFTIPPEYICPISKKIMLEPVVVQSVVIKYVSKDTIYQSNIEKFTYVVDFNSIKQSLKMNNIDDLKKIEDDDYFDPMNHKAMIDSITPDKLLKNKIGKFIENYMKKQFDEKTKFTENINSTIFNKPF